MLLIIRDVKYETVINLLLKPLIDSLEECAHMITAHLRRL